MNVQNGPVYILCDQCGLAIECNDCPRKHIVCGRCQHEISRWIPKSIGKTISFSLTALIFYVPANLFPFMTMELYGSQNSTTIWDGIISLVEAGSYFIAFIVLLASIIIPFFKLLALFFLAATAKNSKYAYEKTQLYRLIESIGRWSMLDIFLLAVLVAIMKLGPWTSVQPEIGSLMFVFVVIFTMLASASFDPRLLWKEFHNEKPSH